jgi:hypothetical protein
MIPCAPDRTTYVGGGKFYTYLHCRPNGDPFYVGKGCDNSGHSRRSHTFGTGRNKLHKAVVAEHGREHYPEIEKNEQ